MRSRYGLDYPRRFICRYCGKEVYVPEDAIDDRRSVYCCARCERQYWRMATKKPTKLTMYKPGMYQWSEKIENKATKEAIKEYERLYKKPA